MKERQEAWEAHFTKGDGLRAGVGRAAKICVREVQLQYCIMLMIQAEVNISTSDLECEKEDNNN